MEFFRQGYWSGLLVPSPGDLPDPGIELGSTGRSPGERIGYSLQYSWAFLVAQLVKNLPAMQETWFDSWVGKIPWRRDRLPTPVFLGFPCGSTGKESTCNVGDLGSIPGLRRSPGEEKGYWPREFHGLYSLWGHKESDTTERLSLHLTSLSGFQLQSVLGVLLPLRQHWRHC